MKNINEDFYYDVKTSLTMPTEKRKTIENEIKEKNVKSIGHYLFNLLIVIGIFLVAFFMMPFNVIASIFGIFVIFGLGFGINNALLVTGITLLIMFLVCFYKINKDT